MIINTSNLTNCIAIWWADLAISAQSIADAYQQLLSDDERERADRFGTDLLRQQHIASRLVLRSVLAKYTEQSAAELEFITADHGKPLIATPNQDLQFNISHTSHYLAIAITRAGAIGIDIECTDRKIDHLALSKRFFSKAEHQQIAQAPQAEQLTAFFNIWVQKEAYLKYLGEGLQHGLERFTVDANNNAVNHNAFTTVKTEKNSNNDCVNDCCLGPITAPNNFVNIKAALAYAGNNKLEINNFVYDT